MRVMKICFKKRVTSAPDLKSLPPTSEAFAQNVGRAHIQAAIWRAAVSPHPPKADATQYGWSKDEASNVLVPVTMPSDVALAPQYILCVVALQLNHIETHSADAMLPIYPAHSFVRVSVTIHSSRNTDETNENTDNDDIPQP